MGNLRQRLPRGRAFATPLGSYLERAPSFDAREATRLRLTSLRPAVAGLRRRREAAAWLADSALFWGKRVYDFFKARFATEGIPTWVKSEVAISWTTWSFGEGFKLLERQISFSHLGTNHGK